MQVLAAHMKAEETVEWGAILAENTDIDLRNLNLAVEKYSTFRPSEEPLFLGRVLRDTESSIVHHFARPGALDYPDTESGIFLSRKLVLDVEADLQKLDEGGDKSLKSLFPSDFNIDPAYEFAKFLNKEGKGVELKNVDEICAKKSKKLNCMTSFKQETSCLKSSQAAEMKAVLGRSLVAVKTCSKFHKDRLAAVKATWASRVPHLEYISDAEDDDHPTKVPFIHSFDLHISSSIIMNKICILSFIKLSSFSGSAVHSKHREWSLQQDDGDCEPLPGAGGQRHPGDRGRRHCALCCKAGFSSLLLYRGGDSCVAGSKVVHILWKHFEGVNKYMGSLGLCTNYVVFFWHIFGV